MASPTSLASCKEPLGKPREFHKGQNYEPSSIPDTPNITLPNWGSKCTCADEASSLSPKMSSQAVPTKRRHRQFGRTRARRTSIVASAADFASRGVTEFFLNAFSLSQSELPRPAPDPGPILTRLPPEDDDGTCCRRSRLSVCPSVSVTGLSRGLPSEKLSRCGIFLWITLMRWTCDVMLIVSRVCCGWERERERVVSVPCCVRCDKSNGTMLLLRLLMFFLTISKAFMRTATCMQLPNIHWNSTNPM